MLNKIKMKNKKAQVADTIAWVVSTVVIIILLILFIFISSMLASTRVVKGDYKDSLFTKSVAYKTDLSLTKSLITYYTIKEDSTKKVLDRELKKMNSSKIFHDDFDVRAKEISGRLVP
jgi:hypothetical protein